MQRRWGFCQGASSITFLGLSFIWTLRDTALVRNAAFHYSFMTEAAMLGGMCSLNTGSGVTKRTLLGFK